MRDLADWLINVERMAGALYRDSSAWLKEDAGSSRFFQHLAEEEALHLDAMECAAEFLESNDLESAIGLDSRTKEKIEGHFASNLERLSSGTLTRDALLECLTATEFSEWNKVFLYVVAALQEKNKGFTYAAAEMQHHLRTIEQFLASMPDGVEHLRSIRRLPAVLKGRILIVDDEKAIVDFLKVYLETLGVVDTAADGEKALGRLRNNRYDVIISDVRMPGVSGIELYRRAASIDPGINERFLFFTAVPHDYLAFFEQHKLRYIEKPALLDELRQVVIEIMEHALHGTSHGAALAVET